MKIHITNLYNFKMSDELVLRQHRFTEAGESLGFYEMGIFSYPVERDTEAEMFKRLDGTLAALEHGDLVFVQLPTENGYAYEKMLLNKIKSYRDTKVVLVCHETEFLWNGADGQADSGYLSLFKAADAVIVPTVREEGFLKKEGISNYFFCDSILSADRMIAEGNVGLGQQLGEIYRKKVLVDARDMLLAEKTMLQPSSLQDAGEEIHVGFGLYDKTGNYSVWVGVAMQSIIENTKSSICFHILHDETLNPENRKKLIQVALAGRKRVMFHFLDKSLFQEAMEQMEMYTIGALFRIMLPELLPDLDKIIYLDADILANRDIKELWNTDISNYCLAAVQDLGIARGIWSIAVKRKEVPADRYFNSGVLYMNLKKIRTEGNMRELILEYLKRTKETDLPDQDALNVVYGEKTLFLEQDWNSFVRPLRAQNVKNLEKKFYHFVGTKCYLYSQSCVDKLYHEVTSRTPWGQEECRMQLEKSLYRITDRIGLLEKLVACCGNENKKFIFYGIETASMKNLYRLLCLKEGDYRIAPDEEQERSGILPIRGFSSLTSEEEPFIVFVLPEADSWKSMEKLEQLGLENEKDYFVIPRLLPAEMGGYV